MDDSETTICRILSLLRNLRSLHHISENPIVEHPAELCLFTKTAFMHSVATRSMWQDCFRKLLEHITSSLKFYLEFFVYACESICKSTSNVFECLLSIAALTANIEVFFHNRGFEYLEYSEGIVKTVFKRNLYETFKDSGEMLGLNEYIESSGYPKSLYGGLRNKEGRMVVQEIAFKVYCENMDPLILKLKLRIKTVKGKCEYDILPQITLPQ